MVGGDIKVSREDRSNSVGQGKMYKAVSQSVLLYGSESLVVTG